MTTPTTTLNVTFVSESAVYENTFGWYNKVTGYGGILFADVEQQGRNAPLTPGASSVDFTVNTADLGNIEFFLISDGYNRNRNDPDDFTGQIKVIRLSDGTWAVADVDSHGDVKTKNGKPDILNGTGANALFTETSKNAGGVDYASSVVGPNQTAATLAGDRADGPTGLIAWEDIAATRKHGGYTRPGDADYNDAVFQVSIVNPNQAPVAVNDDADATEAGGTNNGTPGVDPSGNVLANDTDPDAGDTKTVSAVEGSGANVGQAVSGDFGTLTINADGTYSYVVNNANATVQALQGTSNTLTESFTYTMQDTAGASSSATLTVTIHGTNDAPVITAGGDTSGSVQEDTVNQVTGDLDAVDPDQDAILTWMAQGGTSSGNADFLFTADSLQISRNGNPNFFFDGFDDGIPPPTGPDGTPRYGGNGVDGLQEAGGRLIFDSDHAVPLESITDPFVGLNALLRTSIDPAMPNAGLRTDDDFTASAVFDLVSPDSPRESYGVRLTDRHFGGDGTPPDQDGDDVIDLLVRMALDGSLFVELRELDFVANTNTLIDRIALNPPADADQIRLNLTHDADNVGMVIARFEYLAGGVAVGSHTFTNVAQIFGTETPGFTGDDEDYTRASVFARAPAQSNGDYGRLDIDPSSGAWTYHLDNNRIATQNLAQGQTKDDVFAVTVTDEHGASDTETVTISVTGTNDAPIMQTADVSRTLAEDSPDLTATGLSIFTDVDLIDTHITSASLQSATLASSGPLPLGLADLLEEAMTSTLVDPSTGDGHGNVRWDFALDNDAVQFLPQGDTLVAKFNVTATDNNGAPTTQTVTINITGANDGPVIAAGGDTTGSVQEDTVNQAIGDLDAVDADRGADLIWEAHGEGFADADFLFTADSLRISRNGDPNFFVDEFDDGIPPPSTPPGTPANGYGGSGVDGLREADGRLIFDSDNAIPLEGVGTPDPIVGLNAILRTNINPATPDQGLRIDDDFTASAVFDLIFPDSPRESYALRLTDRQRGGGSGSPEDGDDTIEIRVHMTPNGRLFVQLRDVDHAADTNTLIAQIALAPPAGADQIQLNLAHDADNVGTVNASFDYLSGGMVIGSQTFTDVGHIFGTGTPDFAGDDEDYTRAEVIARAPAQSDSAVDGTYGTLNINPSSGAWTYDLDNSRLTTQSLAKDQTAPDVFTVTVTDEHGASDTEMVTISVTGTNDAPIMRSDAPLRTLAENSNTPDLTASGFEVFTDVDLIDTHTASADLLSATLSNGNPLPPGLEDLLEDAMTALLSNVSTGDGHGEVQWDFALANDAVQFLLQGETLEAVYNVIATDNFGAPTTQTVTINITGADELTGIAPLAIHATDSDVVNGGSAVDLAVGNSTGDAFAVSSNVLPNDHGWILV